MSIKDRTYSHMLRAILLIDFHLTINIKHHFFVFLKMTHKLFLLLKKKRTEKSLKSLVRSYESLLKINLAFDEYK